MPEELHCVMFYWLDKQDPIVAQNLPDCGFQPLEWIHRHKVQLPEHYLYIHNLKLHARHRTDYFPSIPELICSMAIQCGVEEYHRRIPNLYIAKQYHQRKIPIAHWHYSKNMVYHLHHQ